MSKIPRGKHPKVRIRNNEIKIPFSMSCYNVTTQEFQSSNAFGNSLDIPKLFVARESPSSYLLN